MSSEMVPTPSPRFWTPGDLSENQDPNRENIWTSGEPFQERPTHQMSDIPSRSSRRTQMFFGMKRWTCIFSRSSGAVASGQEVTQKTPTNSPSISKPNLFAVPTLSGSIPVVVGRNIGALTPRDVAARAAERTSFWIRTGTERSRTSLRMGLHGFGRVSDLGPVEVSNMSDVIDAGPHGCDNGASTDGFGVSIQASSAVVAFSTSMLKRFREPSAVRRPWRIWFFDTSKQAIGASFIHFANVFSSTFTKEDPCSLYSMNFSSDATSGMSVIWVAVKSVSRSVEHKQWTSLSFGEYGEPPQAAAWLGQGGVYSLIMVSEKAAISSVSLVPGWSKSQEVSSSYIANPQSESASVMLIVPFIVNAVMFWVVDSSTMRKYKSTKSSDDACDAPKQRADCPPAGGSGEESQVSLAAETDSDEASEDEEQRVHVQYSGGPSRPSWVVV